MIYGITAFDDPPPPATTAASLDFINGVYSFGDASLTASQVVSDTSRISASGLLIRTNNARTEAVQIPSGDLLTALLEKSFTCVVDLDLNTLGLTLNTRHEFLRVSSSGDDAYLSFGAIAGASPSVYSTIDEYDGVSVDGSCSTDDPGTLRCGYTREVARRATTIDGLAVVADGMDFTTIATWGFPATKCDLAVAYDNDGTTGNSCGYIKKITIINNPINNSQLAALTA